MSDVSAQKVQTFSLFPSFRKSGCMEQTKVSTNVSSRDTKVSMRCETVTYKGRKQRELWQPTWSLFSAADGARGVVHGLWGVREAGSHCDKGNGINNGAEPQESAPFFHVNITGDIHAWLIPPHSHHMKCTNKWTKKSHSCHSRGYLMSTTTYCYIRQRRCPWISVCTSRMDLSIVQLQCSLNCNSSDISNTGYTI